MNFEAKKVLCMGAVNMDITMYMDHLPVKGETVQTDNINYFPGGKSGNQAVALARHGIKPSYFGFFGDDSFSKILLKLFDDDNIDRSAVKILKGDSAGVALIRIDKEGNNSITFYPGANSKLSPSDIKQAKDEVFAKNDILLISGELLPATTYQVFKTAKKAGMTIIWDPAPVPDIISSEVPSLIDIITPNELETEKLTGESFKSENPRHSISKLKKLGYKYPIITAGEKGAFFENKSGEIIQIIPPTVKTIDTTAAGDCFAGAFTAYYAQDYSMEDSLEKASIAAAISTSILGAQASIVDHTEMSKRISKDKLRVEKKYF